MVYFFGFFMYILTKRENTSKSSTLLEVFDSQKNLMYRP